jgi:hypothetical protein
MRVDYRWHPSDIHGIFKLEDEGLEVWARQLKDGRVELEVYKEKEMPNGSISVILTQQDLIELLEAVRPAERS